jgi:hypothetical protein
VNTESKAKYLTTNVDFLYRNIRSCLSFELGLSGDDGARARKIADWVMSVGGAYLGSDAWVDAERPPTPSQYKDERLALYLQKQREAEMEAELRSLRLKVQDMADKYNLLAKEAVEIVGDANLSHSEKRGAMKWWQNKVWEFAQLSRYSGSGDYAPSDSEIPF